MSSIITSTRLSFLRRMLCIVAVGLLFPLAGYGQTAADALRFAERFPAVGPRLSGMAGASIAGIGDAGAFFSNPAGLGYIDESQLSGTLSTLVAEDRATYNLGAFQSVNHARSSYTAPASINYLHKVPTEQGSLVIGAGYNRTNAFTRILSYRGTNDQNSITDFFLPLPGEFEVQTDAGPDGEYGTSDDIADVTFFRNLSLIAYDAYAIDFDWQLYDSGADVPFIRAAERLPVTQQGEVIEEGQTSEFSLGGAVEVVKNGMVGFSLNLVTGTYNYSRLFEEIDTRNVNDGTGFTMNFEALEYIETLETDLVGINARGGFSTEVISGLRLGISLETPTYYAVHETYNTTIRTFFDDGFSAEYGERSGDVGSGTFDYTLITPWRFGVGASFKVLGFRVAGDLMYVDWSQMRFSAEQDESYFRQVNRTIRTNYAAVWPYRIGVEYQIGALSLRGGYAVQPDPRSGAPQIDRNRIYYTGGLGYQVSSDFLLELSWVHEAFEDRFVPYPLSGAPTVRETISRNMVTLGVQIGL